MNSIIVSKLIGRKVTIAPDTVLCADRDWKHPEEREIVGLYTPSGFMHPYLYAIILQSDGMMKIHALDLLSLVPEEK